MHACPQRPRGAPLLPLHDLLAVLCGSLVGFSLALIGGGGSILATPLLLYVVGLHDPHRAIGTSALAVSANAFANLIPHARAGHVRWRAAFAFAVAGVVGAYLGSSLGKMMDGRLLLVLFALLMLTIALLMLRRRRVHDGAAYPHRNMFFRLGIAGFGAGGLAGFFGIGGGFLIVPGLVFASGMGMIEAIGTSLFCVGAFGLTAALNYAASGWVAWPIAWEFIAGGIAGGWLGAWSAQKLSKLRGALAVLFATVIAAVACFMLAKSLLP
ncbi:sulfite exporter TauE/SafE family protein [Dyella acidisoli]|uniref:sulfite exporter TauE/SafE family protein n=1 Tax=Dyella acidisoli TaxID=1867834 RepID=UPI003C2C86DF